MHRHRKHERFILRGHKLHEARRYAEALPYFDRALRIVPECPLAVYNRANTLHMLARDREAYPLLRGLIGVEAKELQKRCPVSRPRSLQLDAYQLLFWVVLYGKGYCDEAFRYGAEHLRRRKRGIQSVWTAREVRADIAAMRRKWRESKRG
jgi:tetratricopeptide (TPR) repeat protein